MIEHDHAVIERLRPELAPLGRLWPGFEADLSALGISGLDELRGRDAAMLTRQYCERVGRPFDLAILACFTAAVRFAETGRAMPLWRILREDAFLYPTRSA